MSVTRIHQGKQPIRRHYIVEWLEVRNIEPMELVALMNDADTSLPPIDKSQVYRWLKGQMPQEHMQVRIAAALQIHDAETGKPDPDGIMRHPDYDWLTRRFAGRSREEIERIKELIDLATRTGTRN